MVMSLKQKEIKLHQGQNLITTCISKLQPDINDKLPK